jgi:hypothetical protein
LSGAAWVFSLLSTISTDFSSVIEVFFADRPHPGPKITSKSTIQVMKRRILSDIIFGLP